MRSINDLSTTVDGVIDEGLQALSEAGIPVVVLRQRILKLYLAWSDEFSARCHGDIAEAGLKAQELNKFTNDFFTALVGLGVYLVRPSKHE